MIKKIILLLSSVIFFDRGKGEERMKRHLLLVIFFFLSVTGNIFAQQPNENWVRIGVAFSGDITALAVSPSYENDTTIFLGISGGGLWISNDRGNTWEQKAAVPCNSTVTGIALPKNYQYNDGSPCFAVTNEGYFYRSVDDFNGVTDIYSVDIPGVGIKYPMTSIVVGGVSEFDNKVFIGLWGNGVYAHYFGGVGSSGWNYIGPDQIGYCHSLSISSEATQSLWASFHRNGGNAVLRYSGSGSSWNSPTTPPMGEDVLQVRSSWVNPQYLWAGTLDRGMWRSTDGGINWSAACDGSSTLLVNYEVRAIRETPNSGSDNQLWEGRSDRLRKSTSLGASCFDSNPITKINCIDFSPMYNMSGGNFCEAFVGTKEGLYRVECGNLPQSKSPVVIDGKAVAMAHNGKGYFMGSLTGGLYKSLADRRNMVQYNNFPNGKTPQIVAICLHPSYNDEDANCGDANTVIVAANFPDSPSDNGVYASSDAGNSWLKLVGGQWPTTTIEMRDLAISPNFSSDGELFAATSLYLYRWNGSGWSKCSEGTSPNDIYWVSLTPTYNGNSSCVFNYQGVDYNGYPCNMVWIGAKNGYSNVRLYYNFSKGNGLFTEIYPTTFCSSNPTACPIDSTGITFPSDFGVQDGEINHKIFISSSTKGILSNTEFLWGPSWVPFNSGLPRSNNTAPYTYNVVDITSDPDWVNGDGNSSNSILLCAVSNAYDNSQSGIYRAFNASGTPTWSRIVQGIGLSVAYETKAGNNNSEAIAGLGTNSNVNPNGYGAYYLDGLYNTTPTRIEHFSGYYSLPDDVSSCVTHERDPNYVFASSPSMGVFVSTNKGVSFRPFNEGAGGTQGPCRLTNGNTITMLKDRRDTNIDAIYVGTDDGIKSRYTLFNLGENKIYLNLSDGTGTPSSWLHSNWYSGGRTTGFWKRIESIPLSASSYPIWASSPGEGFANLESNLYDGWKIQTTGLPSTPDVKDARSGNDGANETVRRLYSGQMVSDVVKQGYWDYFYITANFSSDNLQVILDDPDDNQSGGSNPNLYLRYGSQPTETNYDYYFGFDGDKNVCVEAITNESFDGSWGGSSPPSGWQITTNESPVTWNEDNWYRYYQASPRAYYPRVVGSVLRTSQDEWIISPPFYLPSTLASAYLTFSHKLTLGTPGAVAYVKFKSTQHPSWITLYTKDTNMPVAVTPTLDLTSYIGETHCQIAFQYVDNAPAAGRSWYFDSFEVYGYYNSSTPLCLSLRPGNWYIGIRGGANNNNPYTLKVNINNGCFQYPTFNGQGENSSLIPPDPKAPIAGATWGTVGATGVVRGTGTSTVTWSTTSAQPSNLNTQTIIQLSDTTLIVGCDSSSSSDKGIFYSPAGDEGNTQWIEASTVAGSSSKNYVDVIQASNGDVLIAANGADSTPGGVWLSGDKGKNWMNISKGFDSNYQELQDIVADSGSPPSYYSSTDTTGLWTRTLTANTYPNVTGISPSSGPSSGGTSVTITGAGFIDTCPTGDSGDCPFSNPIVIFGDTEVTGTYLTSTSISAVSPPHTSGEVVVKVRNLDTRESSAGVGFTYEFTCISPSGFANNTATDLNGCADEGVKIDWSAPSDWGDGGSGTRTFDVLRNGVAIASGISSSIMTYTDTTGTNGTTYSYQVRVNNGCGQSTTTSGAAAADNVNPGAPTITAINDVNGCAQSGVQIVFTAGSGATSHNLWRDGSLVVTGYTSGTTYNPGDTSSHNYTVYAINGSCSTASNTMAGTDANEKPSSPSITGIVDNDPLNLTGIAIIYTSGSPSTAHDLYKDGSLAQSNYVSGATYYPGDSVVHSYVVKAVNGICETDSLPVDGQDGVASSPPPEIAAGSSYPEDAQWWSGSVQNWPTSTLANGYKLYRLVKEDLPNLTNSNNEGCYRDTGAANSYDCSSDDPSGETGRVYYYLVTGYNGAGEGSAGSGRQLSSSTVCSP